MSKENTHDRVLLYGRHELSFYVYDNIDFKRLVYAFFACSGAMRKRQSKVVRKQKQLREKEELT